MTRGSSVKDNIRKTQIASTMVYSGGGRPRLREASPSEAGPKPHRASNGVERAFLFWTEPYLSFDATS